MAEIQRSVLFGKLTSTGYKSLESATVFCKLRGNPYVELVHWLQQILQLQDSDIHRVLRHFGVDLSRLATDVTTQLDRLPRGASSLSGLSSQLDEIMERAWVFASLLFGHSRIRTGYLLVGALESRNLTAVLHGISAEFRKIKRDGLADEFAAITSGSPEDNEMGGNDATVSGGADPGESSAAMSPAEMGKQEALSRYAVDLTAKARSGTMDPILARDAEIRQIMDILMRRRQNNPILTGEAGVGKTAVVEGVAQRIAAGDVPPALRDVSLLSLDLGLLQAGASMKGEFENRLKQVIEEVQSSPKPIILFIDEAHRLVGAGGAAGQNDAANLLKPALARGTLRTIAATTWAEYKRYFEKDPALTRRFQVVKIEEPSEDNALVMMRGLAAVSEKHHKVQVMDGALDAAVRLSHRYIPARQLPDKAVSLLDTACARVAISQHATPAEVEDCTRCITFLENELEILDREQEIGIDHTFRTEKVKAEIAEHSERLVGLTKRWDEEKGLVQHILDLRATLRTTGDGKVDDVPEADPPEAQEQPETEPPPEEAAEPVVDREAVFEELKAKQEQLAELQGENALIMPSVDAQAVAAVVGDWTGIPVGKMVKNEIESVLRLADTLESRVVGQRHALDAIAQRIRTSRAGMEDERKPIGVFLLVGPSGVGKTESALALSDALYGGEQNLITINMSEFQEAHTVSTLKGAPPGYVGYGEGGVLTEAVRRRPYSVVLLDEIEKAHSDVHEIFFQVFDKGWMEDGEGRGIDFKNTVILLTSNVGSDLIQKMCDDPDLLPDPEGLQRALREPLRKVFPAALLGRLIVVPYYPITDEMLDLITRLNLSKIAKRLAKRRDIEFTYGEEVIDLVKSRCTEVESGARAVDAILTHSLLPTISKEYLVRLAAGEPVTGVAVSVKDDDFHYEFGAAE